MIDAPESAIVGYRTRVIDTIRDAFPDFRTVDWYDGLFDVDDVREWGQGAPACYVAALTVPTDHHTTGEMNGLVNIVAVVLTQDGLVAREHDAQNWAFIEGIAKLAKLNTFGDPNAGRATGISFKRLRHPELRREGVGLGIVEWDTSLTFGTNFALERESIRDEAGDLIPMPDDLAAEMESFLGGTPDRYDFEEEP